MIAVFIQIEVLLRFLKPGSHGLWMFRDNPHHGEHSGRLVRRRRYSEVLHTRLVLPEQEQLVCDALMHLGPVETEQGFHAEGVRTIQEVLHCSLDDARATESCACAS